MLCRSCRKEVVLQLPHEVGQRDGGRHQHPQPQPAALEKTTLGTDSDSNEYAEHKKSDGVFGLEPNPGEHAEPEPGSRLAAVDAPRTTGNSSREAAQGVHGQPVVHDQIDRDRDHGQCGQRLGKAAPTHLARQLSRHPDEPRSRDGRQQAQPQERIAERVPGEPGGTKMFIGGWST